MRLNRDLLRALLFFFEAKPDFAKRKFDEIELEGFSPEEIAYTLAKMHEAGLITGEVIRSKSTPERVIEIIPFELTFKGHEFLDSVRDPEIWTKTKVGAHKIGVGTRIVPSDTLRSNGA